MANEATKLTIGGVQHDIKDAEARRLIALLQAALDAMTGTDTTTAIETFQEVLDFLAGVTDDETLVGKITALQTAVNGKVDKENGKGLSTEDFTAALKAKLESLDPYTKAEVNAAIQEAVEGLGGGSVESVTVNGVNHTPVNGVVNLGTIQGAKGDKGEKGDTVVIDPEGLAQFEIANDLDTSDPTQGLSARQGKILKQAISTVQANLQAVVDALANMAFTSAKPTLSQIDWTGGTFYATVVKNLSGCTATDNTTNGQIVEGQTLSMTLTASSGFTLTGATISVTNSKGQSVAYTLNGSTLTVANVTGTITVSVVAVGVFSVVNNDANVNLTANTMSPTSGSSWTGTLAVKSGISNYRLATAPVVTMGGTAVDFTATGNSWDSSTGVMTIGNVTGNIVITSASVEMVAHRVANHFINMESTGDGYVEDGDDYTAVLSPTTGATSNGDLRVFVDGTPLESTDYTFDSTTGALTIPAAKITGDIDIVASACTGVVTLKTTASGSTTIKLTCNGDYSGDAFTTLASGDTHTPDSNGQFTLAANDTISFATNKVNLITVGTPASIKSIDFGGAKVSVKYEMFKNWTGLEEIEGLVGVPYRNSTNINQIFFGCSSLTSVDVTHFEFPSATNVSEMFRNCTALTSIDMRGAYFPSATTLQGMFNGCISLESVNMHGMDFSSVTTMILMFYGCTTLETVDMGGCDFTALTTAGGPGTGAFHNCSSLDTVIIDWNTPALTTTEEMFKNTGSFRADFPNWTTGAALTTMNNMFIGSGVTYVDISGFSTDESLLTMHGIFRSCHNLDEVVIGDLDTSGLNASPNSCFYDSKLNKTLTCKSATPPAINSTNNWLTTMKFGNNVYVSTVVVPSGKKTNYETAWGSTLTWVTFSEEV